MKFKNYTLISRLYFQKGNKTQADTWLKEALKLNSNCFYAKVEKSTQDAKYDCILLLEQLISSKQIRNMKIKVEQFRWLLLMDKIWINRNKKLINCPNKRMNQVMKRQIVQ